MFYSLFGTKHIGGNMRRSLKISFGIFTLLAVIGGILKSFSKDFDRDINWKNGNAARN